MSNESSSHAVERPTRRVSLTVNGEDVSAEVEPRLKLSDFLREECSLRGVRVGCEHGVCGACTVLVDGRGVKSCLTYTVQVDGADLTTVEGLAEDGLHPIQESFHEEHALQCGFCTSGFVMATKELLDDNPNPTKDEVKQGFADNICRCTGYQNIYDAVKRASDRMGDGETATDGGETATDGGETATDGGISLSGSGSSCGDGCGCMDSNDSNGGGV